MKREIILLCAATAVSLASSAKQPEQGYRGFIDWSNNYRYKDEYGLGYMKSNTWFTGVSTVHGYQFNPSLFVGAGLDLEHCSSWGSNQFFVFMDGRTDQKFGKFTPFGDIRLGYSCGSGGGVYFSPSIGYRFNWGRKTGVNLGIGMTLYTTTWDVYGFYDGNGDKIEGDINWDRPYYVHKEGTTHWTEIFLSFRLGIDF